MDRWTNFKAYMATERMRALLAFTGGCITLWLETVLPNHPIANALLVLAPIGFAVLLFWPELARLRVTYAERTRNESPAWLYILALAALIAVSVSSIRFYITIKNQPTTLTGDEWAESYIEGKRFHIADLADSQNVIEGRTVEGCWLYGPAVLWFGENSDLGYSTVYGDFNANFLTVQLGSVVGSGTGVILVKDCKFRHCHFFGVTFLGTAAQIAQWKQINTGAGTAHPNEHAAGAPE